MSITVTLILYPHLFWKGPQGSHAAQKSGNTWEFDNYIQGLRNILEFLKIRGKLVKLLEFKHFIPSITKTNKPATAQHFLRYETLRDTGSRKLGKLTVAI